jgi:hypothetical protein
MYIFRCLIATAFIFITTADDTVWLLPILLNHKKISSKIMICLTFIGTLQVACIIVATFLYFLEKSSLIMNSKQITIYKSLLQVIGLVLIWTTAIILHLRKCYKTYKKNRARRTLIKSEDNQTRFIIYGSVDNNVVKDLEMLNSEIVNNKDIELTDDAEGFPSLITVSSLTFFGALDEIVCFPSLVLSNTFSLFELSLGCLIASILILTIITLLLNIFKPILDFFDRIPLYVIIYFFAVIQTVNFICL